MRGGERNRCGYGIKVGIRRWWYGGDSEVKEVGSDGDVMCCNDECGFTIVW